MTVKWREAILCSINPMAPVGSPSIGLPQALGLQPGLLVLVGPVRFLLTGAPGARGSACSLPAVCVDDATPPRSWRGAPVGDARHRRRHLHAIDATLGSAQARRRLVDGAGLRREW